MKRAAILFALTLILMYSCIRSSDDGIEEVRKEAAEDDQQEVGSCASEGITLTELDSFLLNPGEQLIGRFREKMHVTDELLLFIENRDQQIWMFDHSGELVGIIGGRGRGPEEFTQISGVFVDEKNRIIVTDGRQNLVKIFDLNGELINTFSLFDDEELYISSRDIHVHDDILYLQVAEAEYLAEIHKSRLIARYDLSGAFIDLIGRTDPSIEESNHYLFSTQDTDYYEYFGTMPSHWVLLEEEIDPFLPRQEIIDRTVVPATVRVFF